MPLPRVPPVVRIAHSSGTALMRLRHSVACRGPAASGKGKGTAHLCHHLYPWKRLGHTNIKTTQIYARITDQKVSFDMEKLSEKLNGQHPELTEPFAKSKFDT